MTQFIGRWIERLLWIIFVAFLCWASLVAGSILVKG